MVLGEDFDTPTQPVNLVIPVPDSMDLEQLHIYCVDLYGEFSVVEFEVKYGSAYITTDVLGMFLLVEGEATLPEVEEPNEGDETLEGEEPSEGDEPNEGENADDKPADKKPNKSKKDTKKSNGWILWVAIGGGVVVLAAAAVIVLLVLKKRKAAQK
jgi:hypothetical protein